MYTHTCTHVLTQTHTPAGSVSQESCHTQPKWRSVGPGLGVFIGSTLCPLICPSPVLPFLSLSCPFCGSSPLSLALYLCSLSFLPAWGLPLRSVLRPGLSEPSAALVKMMATSHMGVPPTPPLPLGRGIHGPPLTCSSCRSLSHTAVLLPPGTRAAVDVTG